MKKVIIAGMLLALCSTGFCQTDDPGCNLYATQKDTTCVSTSTCATATNCPTQSFTIVCVPNATYWVKGFTKCEGTHCAHCAACVKVKDSGGATVVSFDTRDVECQRGEYCQTVTWTPSTAGAYSLEVCLVPCNSVDGSTCCDEYDCRAIGEISSQTLSCQ